MPAVELKKHYTRSSVTLFLLLGGGTGLATSEPVKPIEPRTPRLTSVFPQGAEPGTHQQVEVLGEFLDRAHTVLFLDPSIRGQVSGSTYTSLALDFTVATDAALGPHYFRVITPRGASNVLLFRV